MGSGFWSETVDINARNPKTPVDGRLQSMYVTLASIRERLCALGRSKHIQLQSDVDEIESIAGTVNVLIRLVLSEKGK